MHTNLAAKRVEISVGTVAAILADIGWAAKRMRGQNRSAFRKKKPDIDFEEIQLRRALRAIAVKHPAWGKRKARLHLLAQPEGTAWR